MSSTIKGITIIILTLLMLSVSTTALEENFQLHGSKHIDACSCAMQDNTLLLKNTGDVTSIYALQQSGSAREWSSFKPTRVILKPGQKKELGNFIRPTCGSQGKRTLTTTVTTKFDKQKVFHQDINAQVCDQTNIALEKQTTSALPAETSHYLFALQNNAKFPETYQVWITGEHAEHFSLKPSKLFIAPGQTKKIPVFVELPYLLSGNLPFTFHVLAEQSGVTKELPFTLDVQAHYPYTVVLPPSVSRCEKAETTFPVQVQNTARGPNTFTLTAHHTGLYTADPFFLGGKQKTTVNLPFNTGKAGEYTLSVEVRPDLGISQLHQIPFTVNYCDAEGNVIVPEEKQQDPVLLLGGIVFVLFLLIMIAIIWLVLKAQKKPKHVPLVKPIERESKKESKKESQKEAKKEKRTFIKGQKKTWKKVLAWILIVLLILGVCTGGFFLYKNTKERILSQLEGERALTLAFEPGEGYTVKGSRLIFVQGEEELKVPLTLTNMQEETREVNLDFDVAWITSTQKTLTLQPEQASTIILEITPSVAHGSYRFKMEITAGGEDTGEETTQDFLVTIKNPQTGKVVGIIAGVLGGLLIVLLLLFLVIRAIRKRRKKAVVKEIAEELSFKHTATKPVKHLTVKKKGKVKKAFKGIFIIFIILLLLTGLIVGLANIYKNALEQKQETNKTANWNDLLKKVQQFKPGEQKATDVTLPDAQEHILHVRENTIIPLNFINTNSDDTYKISAQNAPAWIQFSPKKVTVPPTSSRQVETTINVQEVDNGKYVVHLNVQGAEQEHVLVLVVQKSPLKKVFLFGLLGILVVMVLIWIVKKVKNKKKSPAQKKHMITEMQKEYAEEKSKKTKLQLK